jgi:riboflavin biosynthesis pyrimidine reductase
MPPRPTLLQAEPALSDLLQLYAAPPYPSVRMNFVSTLDGHASGPDGRAGSINSAPDQRVFAALRALSDAVVVGAGTIRAEGYRPLRTRSAELLEARRAAGRPDHPTLVAVTASGDLPDRLLEGAADSGDVLVLCTERTPRRRLVDRLGADAVLVCGTDGVQPHQALSLLAQRGLVRVLSEGGPHLFGDWLRAGVVDDLCLTLRPTLLGGVGPRIAEVAALNPRATFEPVHVLHAEGDLILRYRVVS